MSLMSTLDSIWASKTHPFLIVNNQEVFFEQIKNSNQNHLKDIVQGDVVALIGDFDDQSIADMINLFDRKVILVPLSPLTSSDHQYFFESARVNWVVQKGKSQRISPSLNHPLLDDLRKKEHAGLVLFSSGTTGRPKAILHDLSKFLDRYHTPRATQKTLAFLMFDHIGGINTLLHTLFNSGTVICTESREIEKILDLCRQYEIEILPTTPTFLRLLLMSGAIPLEVPTSLKVITYGTERMDEGTLNLLCKLLPSIDFRQTFGMSELGILRVKSKARDSLFMKIGGEGIEWRVDDNQLKIKSESRMIGYLNAPSPFSGEGWYDTNDLVEMDGEYIKIIGRNNDVVNVSGLKFLVSEVERVVLTHKDVELATVTSGNNPITGQHIELEVQARPGSGLNSQELKQFLETKLLKHMRPLRITFSQINVGHRFKKL